MFTDISEIGIWMIGFSGEIWTDSLFEFSSIWLGGLSWIFENTLILEELGSSFWVPNISSRSSSRF